MQGGNVVARMKQLQRGIVVRVDGVLHNAMLTLYTLSHKNYQWI